LAALAAFAAAVGLAACALDPSPADFTFLNREPETIDPGLVADPPGGIIALNLWEGLLRRDPQSLAPRPGIARSWKLTGDGRVYIFHLRPALWSDGTRVTSADFQYAWTRLLAPATGARYASMLYCVEGARAFNAGTLQDPAGLGLACPDDSTFVVQLESATPYFLDLCCLPSLLPVPARTIQRFGDRWLRPEHIVVNGPFQLTDWQLNRRMRLRRNAAYWDAANVTLRTVDALPGDYINGNFNRYTSGVLDFVDGTGIPLAIVDQLRSRPDFHSAPNLTTYFYRFNVTRPPLTDARVRQALYHAVDATAIVEHVTRGGQQPAHSLVPPGMPGYREVQLAGFQPERARQLLAEAGFPGGSGFPRLSLLFNTSEANKQIAEVIQQQWREVLGIELELRNQEFKVFTATVRELDYDIARGNWTGDYLDPNTFLEIWASGSGNNRTGFASSSYDSLLAAAARALDPARRLELLRDCETIVTQQQCVILPIYYFVENRLYDGTRWEGLQPNLLGHLDLRAVRRKATAPVAALDGNGRAGSLAARERAP
jgi:oligopeptide transport system substrate-binding protein